MPNENCKLREIDKDIVEGKRPNATKTIRSVHERYVSGKDVTVGIRNGRLEYYHQDQKVFALYFNEKNPSIVIANGKANTTFGSKNGEFANQSGLDEAIENKRGSIEDYDRATNTEKTVQDWYEKNFGLYQEKQDNDIVLDFEFALPFSSKKTRNTIIEDNDKRGKTSPFRKARIDLIWLTRKNKTEKYKIVLVELKSEAGALTNPNNGVQAHMNDYSFLSEHYKDNIFLGDEKGHELETYSFSDFMQPLIDSAHFYGATTKAPQSIDITQVDIVSKPRVALLIDAMGKENTEKVVTAFKNKIEGNIKNGKFDDDRSLEELVQKEGREGAYFRYFNPDK